MDAEKTGRPPPLKSRDSTPEGRYVIHDPETAPVGCHHQVVKMILNGHPVNRRLGHVGLKRKPAFTIIKGNIKGIFRSGMKPGGFDIADRSQGW